jgi:2-polyprenyl-6-methoxyphenol hydroxylase-like FAD-dependent oxidoreductase
MTDRFDVVVVGARCAGSPLATLLARQGVRVAVVERATFPRDTLSTHVFEADGLAFLARLGLTERLRATGTPFMRRTDNRVEDFRWVADIPQYRGDVGGIASVRRPVLDPILAQAAEEAGAEVRFATKVTGLVQEAGRVRGVRVSAAGGESELHARLVVGADGRNSTIAKLCGARKYNVTNNERFGYWSYFEGANLGAEPTFVFHMWANRLVLGGPTDGGLYQALAIPDLSELAAFRRDLEGNLMRYVGECEPVATALERARRVGKVFGAVRWTGFFRDASGPGWVLVGDAGHHKDPTPGRGISDAFRQVDALVPAIVAGLDGSGHGLDEALKRWGRWRDGEFAEHYWMATDLGKAGPPPTPVPELMRRLHAQGKIDLFMDLLGHRRRPSAVLSPARVLGATGRLLARRGCDRRALLREVGALVAEDSRRRWRNRHPVYAPEDARADDGGLKEVDEVAA